MRRRLVRTTGGLLLLAMVVGLSLLLSPVRRAAWTTLFLADFLAGDAPSLFKALAPVPAVTSDSLLAADSLWVPYELYRVPARNPVGAILFTHGLAHEGKRDSRVRQQANRLARAGFVVMTPDLQQMKRFALGFQDVEAVVACLGHLRRLPGVDSTLVGVIAPSFGAGPVLIAISRPGVRDQVRFAMTFGGYYDLRETLRYTLTGAYDAAGFAGTTDLAVNRQNRWKFLRGNLHLLPPSPTRAEYTRFLTAKLDDPFLDVRPFMPRFSPDEQRTLVFMDNEDPARFDSLYANLPPSIPAWVDTLSLARYAPRITARLLIVHSRADAKVPFTEALLLSQNLPLAPPPRVVIVSLFEHMDLKLEWRSLDAVWRVIVPGLEQLWSLAHELLGYRRR